MKASTTELFRLSEESSERMSRLETKAGELAERLAENEKMGKKDRKRMDEMEQRMVRDVKIEQIPHIIRQKFP